MAILETIGLNLTVAYQLGIFVVCYLVLTQVLFNPYFRAFVERKKRTVGNQEGAERLLAETEELETTYAKKAREINSQFKELYDEQKSEAYREYDRMVSEARDKSLSMLTEARSKISSETSKAKADLNAQTNDVKQAVVTQLLGKGV